MLTKNYLKLLSVDSVNRFCSKPYGFELLILLYNFTKNNGICIFLDMNFNNISIFKLVILYD